MRIAIVAALVLAGAAGVAVAGPKVYVTVDGERAEHVRSYVVAALESADSRSFDVTIDSSVDKRGRSTEVTIKAKAVISDARGIHSMIAVSACARGNARKSTIDALKAQATGDAIKRIAQRVRITTARR